jgi:long-chain fatty acid transport protein
MRHGRNLTCLDDLAQSTLLSLDMRMGLRFVAVLAGLLASGRAHAGGFELDLQSARGAATVGAQTAVAADPSAIYYNPAGLAFQKGLGALGGIHFVLNEINVHSNGVTNPGGGLKAAPMLYVAQRIDSHFSVGVGVFSNFIEQLDYPSVWPGAAGANNFVLSTTTINPTVAIRPHPRVAIGFGLDIVPTELDFARTNDMNGSLHSETDGVGFGGNVSVLVIAIPRWLTLGASYRSAMAIDLSGIGNTDGVDDPLNATTTLQLPHNFSFGASTRPIERLTVSLDAKVAVWHELQSLTVSFLDPMANPATTQPVKDTIDLNMRDSYGFRAGAEYRPTDYFWLAAGLGYDRTPVRRGWLQPIIPDNDRVLVGVGMGGTYRFVDLGASYSAQVITSRTSSNPIPGNATYSGVRHLLTLNVGLRFPQLLEKRIAPRYQ